MQENYEDGTKGEIKLIEWSNLVDEIKASLDKPGVESVTITKAVGIKKAKLTEEKESPFKEFMRDYKP